MNQGICGIAAGFGSGPYPLLGSPRPFPTIDARAFDADAARFIDAVEAADGQRLEIAVAAAVNDFVVGCKTDGIWGAIKASCILMGARTLSGALTPLVGVAPTNNNFVSGDYNRKTGLKGNGSNKSLNTNRANSADPRNSNHNAVYASESGTGDSAYLASGAGIAGQNQIFTSGGYTAFRSRHSTGSTAFVGVLGTPSGFIGMSRSSPSSYSVRAVKSDIEFGIDSNAPHSVNLLAYSIPGFGFFSTARVAFYSIGESLPLGLLESRVANLYAAIGSAIP